MTKIYSFSKMMVAIVALTGTVVAFQNCSPGFKVSDESQTSLSSVGDTPPAPVKCALPDGSQLDPEQFVSGFILGSALSPTTCGVQVRRTCLSTGSFDGPVPVYQSCLQQCVNPGDSQPMNAGATFVYYSKANGVSQADCDSARVTSTCQQETGLLNPPVPGAAQRFATCLVQGQTCAYTSMTGTATPSGNMTNATVSGFAYANPTYPTLCGASVTRTCQVSGQWSGTVPLYTACTQKCIHPDNNQPVDAGTQLAYYIRSSGTAAECAAAARSSTCQQATGLFNPVPATPRFSTCQIVVPPPPTPTPTPTPAPTPTPPPPTPTTGGLSCDPAAITCVEVVSSTAQASVPFTFGQPFKAGNWPSTQGLMAKESGGTVVPLQFDETSNHVDGSVRLAVLSMNVSNLAANQPKIINFYLDTKKTSTATVPADPAWNLELEVKVYNASNAVTATLVAQPQSLLKAQIASGAGKRLSGAIANEYTVVVPLQNSATGVVHPHLHARLHTRLYDNGTRIRTDVVMENNWTFKAGSANIIYDLTIKQNGQVVHTQPKLTHYHHARWHKVVWTGSVPSTRLRHNMPYFMDSKITANYNLSYKIPESVLADEARAIAAANTKPMGKALLTEYFPQTGARPELAPLPRWTVLFLLTQDDRARASMFANADASASVPIHYRDEATDLALDIQRHPNASVRYEEGTPAIPDGSGSTIWEADRAHQASFSFIPYVVTGDAFYLEEVQFWASWNMAWSDPGTRGNGQGLLYNEQIRGQAWSLRSLGEAAHVTPENHPLKGLYKSNLNNNLQNYYSTYTNPAKHSPLGAISIVEGIEATIPWQNDFMATTFGRLAENNEPRARDIMLIISKFNVGRFMNEANGFCTVKAATFDMYVTNANGQFFTNWRDMYNRKYPDLVGRPCAQVDMNEEAYPDDPLGMSAHARGALAVAANLGIPDALAAYNKWKALTPALDDELLYEPAWAIVPK